MQAKQFAPKRRPRSVSRQKLRGPTGIEPVTSPTRTENHTTRPWPLEMGSECRDWGCCARGALTAVAVWISPRRTQEQAWLQPAGATDEDVHAQMRPGLAMGRLHGEQSARSTSQHRRAAITAALLSLLRALALMATTTSTQTLPPAERGRTATRQARKMLEACHMNQRPSSASSAKPQSRTHTSVPPALNRDSSTDTAGRKAGRERREQQARNKAQPCRHLRFCQARRTLAVAARAAAADCPEQP